ncbi:MAG: hypothetical protein H6698_03360 [Myxococcales bacterium]|nr:hypothetical protein [Myxococcales bacterium]MCB9519311.1 hypothetical protein [Myxococcales bacterium]MCB9530755.1 hypothetical protein [Myxococcales bacterium]MCB9533351.1 hypothetical protein [Myxococcales bacterium]
MRLFLCLEPAVRVCERLSLLQEDLTDPLHLLGADVSWTRPERLGVVVWSSPVDVTEDVAWLRSSLRESLPRAGAQTFSVSGARFAPGPSAPRLIVAGVTGELGELTRAVDDALPAGLPAGGDGAEGVAVVQVGRVRGASPGSLAGVLTPYEATQFGETTAQTAVLFSTSLQGTRAQYTVLERFALVS